MSITVSIDFEKKPTAVYCECNKCQKSIEKGNFRFGVIAHGYRSSGSSWYHQDCFFEYLWSLMELKGTKRHPWLNGVNFGIRLVSER